MEAPIVTIGKLQRSHKKLSHARYIDVYKRQPFEAGLNASIVGTLDDYVADMKYVDSWKAAGDDDAELGYFVYVDSIRDKEEGAIPTDRSGNNGLALSLIHI